MARLDRSARAINKANREAVITSHSLHRFVRRQLIQTSALPTPDDDAKALGQKRYVIFLDSLARTGAQRESGRRKTAREQAVTHAALTDRPSHGNGSTPHPTSASLMRLGCSGFAGPSATNSSLLASSRRSVSAPRRYIVNGIYALVARRRNHDDE